MSWLLYRVVHDREEFQRLRAQDLYHDPADRDRFRRRIAEEGEGCPWAQGFHFGRPVTAAEFRELLEETGS